MIIRCPNCSTTYRVNGSVLDAPRPTFRCSRCKHVFTIHLRLRIHEEGSPATEAAPGRGQPPVAPAAGGERDTRGHVHDDDRSGADTADRDTADTAGRDAAEPDPDAAEPDPETARDTPAPPQPPTHPESRPPAAASLPDTEATENAFEEVEPADPDFDPATTTGDDNVSAGGARKPDFEIDDDFLFPTRPTPAPAPVETRGSVVPLASLAVLSVIAFVLIALIYQVNPKPLDSMLGGIPWYGTAVFENRHFKSTLVLEGLASGVQPVQNRKEVFAVSGTLVNRGDRSIRKVRIEVQLFDAEGKQVGRQTAFVGNAISAKILQDMSLREISLLQSLEPVNSYGIPANGSANFTVALPKPKTAVKSFNCRVLSADGAA